MELNPRVRGYYRRYRRRNPDGLFKGIGVQDVAVASVAFIATEKVSEMAKQANWMDVGVRAASAVAWGIAADSFQGTKAMSEAAILGGFISAGMRALGILTNGRWGSVPAGSVYLGSGTAFRALPPAAGVPAMVRPPVYSATGL
jgi:hypothetical protein